MYPSGRISLRALPVSLWKRFPDAKTLVVTNGVRIQYQVCFLPLNLSSRLGFVGFITDKFDWEYVLPIYWKTATLD